MKLFYMKQRVLSILSRQRFKRSLDPPRHIAQHEPFGLQQRVGKRLRIGAPVRLDDAALHAQQRRTACSV